MSTTHQLLLIAAMVVTQGVAMGLPYWMGRLAGQALRDGLQEKIDLLQCELQAANERGLLLCVRSTTYQAQDNGGNHV